jgi:hypothetical protein
MSDQVKTFQTMSDYFKQWKVQPLFMVEGINQSKEFNPLLPSYFPSSYLPGDLDDLGFDDEENAVAIVVKQGGVAFVPGDYEPAKRTPAVKPFQPK